ncbi:hypothetical protein PHLCEN_2v1568 [Hermanssonia centrifuga]|uniref:Uncharacterized protein n=1 Tax=Hermanssonia centrifuga TaxID=98765 RepID=A0A2R6RZH0_9APHY|nr:hypothetical protein PHLCEN_2v1568 [Hermanssonia centrifuga]
MSKSLGLVIGTSLNGSTSPNILNTLDLLLHARVPPLIRALPHVESLAMFRAEEGQEEIEIRHTLGVGIPDELQIRESLNANQVAAVLTPIPVTSPSAPPIAHMQVDPVQHAKPSSITSPEFASHEQPSSTYIQGTQPSSGAIPVSQGDLPSLSKATLLPPSAAAPSPPVTAAPTPSISTSLAPSQGTMEADEDEPMPSIDMDSDSDAE